MGSTMSSPVAALLHYPFDPASRAARLALGEARVEFSESPVKPWEPDCILGQVNPTGMPPVVRTMLDGRTLTLCELGAILGWIEDSARGPLLMPVDPVERAETRILKAFPGADILIHPDPRGRTRPHGGVTSDADVSTGVPVTE